MHNNSVNSIYVNGPRLNRPSPKTKISLVSKCKKFHLNVSHQKNVNAIN